MKLRFDPIAKRKKAIAKRALKKAIVFMKQKYGKFSLAGVTITFRDGTKGSDYRECVINISMDTILTMYKRKRCKLTTPKDGIDVGIELRATLSALHECTHHQQRVSERPMTEVETTNNEIEYLYLYHRDIYNKLIPVK